MRALGLGLSVAGLLVMTSGPMDAAIRYPLTLTLDARFASGVTTITSKVTIKVVRVMDDAPRTRVSDALKFGGYPNFVKALRPLPPLGSIETQSAKTPIRYVREDQDGASSRLVLVADAPLFFLGKPSKSKAGYELTVVDLRLDGQGKVTGQMAGAARVKPSPDGGVLLDDYADALIQLEGTVGQK
jgi:hypothetical protein